MKKWRAEAHACPTRPLTVRAERSRTAAYRPCRVIALKRLQDLRITVDARVEQRRREVAFRIVLVRPSCRTDRVQMRADCPLTDLKTVAYRIECRTGRRAAGVDRGAKLDYGQDAGKMAR